MARKSHRELLFEDNPQPMYVYDLRTLKFLAVNEAALKRYGYTRKEFLRMTAKDIRPAEDVPAFLKAYGKGAKGISDKGTWRHVKKDGTRLDVEITTANITWNRRRAQLVVANDITERKRADEALAEERRLLRTLIDAMPDYIYVKDAKSRFVLANRGVATLMGFTSPEELLGKTDFDWFPKELASAYFSDEQAILKSGVAVVNDEERTVDARKRAKWTSTSKVPLRNQQGEVIGIIGIGRDITRRKKAEDALRAEQELLRTLIDTLPDRIYVKDAKSRWLVANRALAGLVGAKNPADMLGKTDFDYFPKEMASAFYSDEQTILQSGEPLANKEEEGVDPHGNTMWTSTSKVPWRKELGEVIGIMGIGRDITRLKQAEESLRETNQTLSALVAASPAAIVCVGRDLNVTLWNSAAERLFGWSEKEVLGKPVPSVPADHMSSYRALRERVFRGESISSYESLAVRKDGSVFDVIISMAALCDAAGEIRGAMDIALDITDRKTAEAQLHLQAAALSSAANSIVISDKAGRILWANPAFTVLTGYSLEEVLGQTFAIFNSGKHPRSFFEHLWETVLNGEVWHGEVTNRRKDGTIYTEEQTVTPVRNENDEITHFVTIQQDITERKRTEAEHVRLITAIEQLAEAVVITDTNGTIEYVNPAFTHISGYSRDDVIGQNPRVLKSGKQDAAMYKQLWETILKGQPWHGELINKRKDGTLYTEEQAIAPVRDSRGEVAHFVAIKQDVTERKSLEGQLHQAQKMESVGRLAGGVAHDFNNLLSVIIGYSDVLAGQPGLDSRALKQIEEIKKAGDRAAALTRQLLAFSRQQVLEPKIVNLNSIIVETEKMLRRLIGEDIEFRTKLSAEIGSVKVDPGQVEQILMNLVVNARDAMPGGGKVLIETHELELDEEYARHHAPCTPGWYVVLTVTDTGVGMDQSVLAHIFEPFFTTKEVGKGTGLGLSTVYGIVKQSGGYVWAYCEPGQGSAFKIYLPRVDQPVRPAEVSDFSPEDYNGSETVLVVEDDESVRDLICNILGQSGYTVLQAETAAHAIEIARQNPSIELVLTDVVMPEMNGPEMAKKLEEMKPGVKVIFMSGYAGTFAAARGLLTEGTPLLQKPFSKNTLLKKLRETLEARAEHKPA